MATTPLLEMRGIKKAFPGVRALDNVDFDLRQGETHVLVGANGAGKSTLIKILTGVVVKDEGSIYLRGEEAEIGNPRRARSLGISAIYQELNLVPQLDAAQNIYLGHEPCRDRLGAIITSEIYLRSAEIVRRIRGSVEVNVPVRHLSVAKQQIVAIAKALSYKAQIMVMDEPTSALSPEEIEELFNIIRSLNSEGVAVIYISHRLNEISQIGHRVTVLRDGRKVATEDLDRVTMDSLVRMMVGADLPLGAKRRTLEPGKELLRVDGLRRGKVLGDVSFALREREILGIAGLTGAGKSELARAIFGADRVTAGSLWVQGKTGFPRRPLDAVNMGIGFLPEDRKAHGLVLQLAVKDNVTLANLRRLRGLGGAISLREEERVVEQYAHALDIKMASQRVPVRNLSGGNQQKVVLAKWLFANSKVIIFDEPTRGIDVKAKAEVYALIEGLLNEGKGVILISSELPEVLALSDRILVLSEGKVTGEFSRDEASAEGVLRCAFRRGE